MKIQTLGSKGQSMIQVLMAMGLVAILLTLMASIFSGQNKEARAIEERLSALEVERTLVATLQTGGVLTYQLKLAGVPLLDSTTFPKTLNGASTGGVLDYILASGNPGAPSIVKVGVAPLLSTPQLVVKTISLTINPGTSDQYPASLVVSFDDTKLVRAIKPVSVQMTIQTDPATGATVKKIVSADNPLCPAGFYTMANGSCVACAPGTAQPLAGQTSCTPCSAKTYSSNGAGQSGSTSCVLCGTQDWSAASADQCTLCANYPANSLHSGTVFSGPATNATCPIGTLSCNSGYENGGTTTTCSICAAGKYSAGGTGACSTCGVDNYSLAGATTCTACGVTQYAPAGSGTAASCLNCSNFPTNGTTTGTSYSGQGGGSNQCPYTTVGCNPSYTWNNVTTYAGAACNCSPTAGGWTTPWLCTGAAATRSCTNPTPACGGADCSGLDGGSPTGTCTAYYVDADGDGHGDSAATPVYIAPGMAPPTGYVTNHDDCCDSGSPSAGNVYPGSTGSYLPITGCGARAGSYDYDCDGSITKVAPATSNFMIGSPSAHTVGGSTVGYNISGTCHLDTWYWSGGYTNWSAVSGSLACGAAYFPCVSGSEDHWYDCGSITDCSTCNGSGTTSGCVALQQFAVQCH